MVNKKVLDYIRKNLHKGISEKEITSSLKKTGLSQKIIEKGFAKVKNSGKQKNKGSVQTHKKLNPKQTNTSKIREAQMYIISAMRNKLPEEKIRSNLISAGWKKDMVSALIDQIKKRNAGSSSPKPSEVKFEVGKGEKEIRQNKDNEIQEEYKFKYMDMEVRVIIYSQKGEAATRYNMIVPVISGTTDLILEEIRQKLINQINLGTLEIAEGDFKKLDKRIQDRLTKLVRESFPHVQENIQKFLISYLISKVLGLGIVEIIKADESLEEIVINNSSEPVFVYHKKWGWCKTNQQLKKDEQITHLASMTGRKIGREITNLTPLLDAHLPNGDRVNATIKPITVDGPTITIRKFSNDPWTITKFLKTKTMTYQTAALIWLAIQYELSMLVVGGTASGKTSCLNVLTNLIPPNQRIISIEDTREIRLPKYMHWVPMVSREPNPEGKGGIGMEDLLVNSLRMRPDRIIVGEVRKRVQAETLFEAIHTGHSCYATFHANNAEEAVIRLTNPPVSLSKALLPAVSLMIVQYRNRRSGVRRTFQIAEVDKNGNANVIYQYDPKTDSMNEVGQSKVLFKTLELFTGNTQAELKKLIDNKIKVLKYLVKHEINSINEVGKIMSMYYTEYDYLMDLVNKDKKK